MATTYYARSTGGNWNANTSWDLVSSAGAGPAGPPTAGDTAILDAGSGNITLTANAACLNLTMTGYASTFAFGAYYLLLGSGGSITLGGTLTISSGIGLLNAGNFAITCNSIKLPKLYNSANSTITLNDALLVGTLINTSQITYSGAFNITYDNYYMLGAAASNLIQTLVSGQTLAVTTLMSIVAGSGPGITYTFKSSTASSPAYLNYNGPAANCFVSGITFTDIDASGSAQVIDNWYGGTLTRCTNIENKTSTDLARAADASKILTGQTVGGVAGSASAGGAINLDKMGAL